MLVHIHDDSTIIGLLYEDGIGFKIKYESSLNIIDFKINIFNSKNTRLKKEIKSDIHYKAI